MGVIHIGSAQTSCYIIGIHGVMPTSTTQHVILNSNGQLGSISRLLATALEYSATLNTSMPIGYMCDMWAYKVGKIVCVMLFAKVFALGSPEPLISFARAFLAGYHPTTKVIFPVLFMSRGIWDTGLIAISKFLLLGLLFSPRTMMQLPVTLTGMLDSIQTLHSHSWPHRCNFQLYNFSPCFIKLIMSRTI
jgi:hypothetical protein